MPEGDDPKLTIIPRDTRLKFNPDGTVKGIVGLRAEFLLLSFWESEAAVREFAGDPLDRAVFYPEDDRYLLEKEPHSLNHQVFFDSADNI